MKAIVVFVLLGFGAAHADPAASVSSKCVAEGAKAALATALTAANAEGLVSVGLNLSNNNQVYVEGNDILVPVSVTTTQAVSSAWYYVRIKNVSNCVLATPVPYKN